MALGRHLLELTRAAPVSAGQVGFFLAYAWATCMWLYSCVLQKRGSGTRSLPKAHSSDAGELAENGAGLEDSGEPAASSPAPVRYSFLGELLGSPAIKCLSFQTEALKAANHTLKSMVEFGSIMTWFFLADRTNMLPEGSKNYTRDSFFFVYLMLVLFNFSQPMKVWRTPTLLNRSQTEEWKGWMQVLFLLYHYYAAGELYNAIRVFIAAYVWMTGFGNFIYYHKTGDYTLGRFFQMMWRLNFLVLFTCIALQNSYMLYYICPMHTLFTLFVYAALAIMPKMNTSRIGIGSKMAWCFALVAICWDIPSVFYTFWQPFSWLVGYVDPRRPKEDVLHEWYFRSSLDRYVWIYGMICGWIRPWVESTFLQIDAMPTARKWTVRAALVAICVGFGQLWYEHVYVLPKLEYNRLHPYTSWIPITIWILLRNLTPAMRTFSLSTFAWLGCITLETYICQYHTWLSSSIPDGQPVALLQLLPTNFPLLNFAATTTLYVFLSHRLFVLTNDLKDAAIPLKDNRLLLQNAMLMGAAGVVALVFGTVIA